MSAAQTSASKVAFWASILLVIVCVAWEWFLAPLRPGGSWMVLKVLPLVFILKGFYRADNYTMQVGSMLILLYMSEGLVRLTEPRGVLWLALFETILSLVIFVALLAHLRPLKKAAKTQQENQKVN